DEQMRELLELRELVHQAEDRGDVGGRGRAGRRLSVSRAPASSRSAGRTHCRIPVRRAHASSGASDSTISMPPKRDATQLYAWHAIHSRMKPRIALSSSALDTVLRSTEPYRKNATSTPSNTI